MESLEQKVKALDGLVEELYGVFTKQIEQTEDGDLVFSVDKVLSPVWKRNEVVYHLTFLELVNIQLPDKRHDLFMAWLADNELQETVAKYEIELRATLREFNKQMILDKIRILRNDYGLHRAKDMLPKKEGIIPYSELLAYVEKIDKAWDREACHWLDSQYYREAGSHFGRLGKLWKELKDHDLGKLFVLEQKDITAIHRGKSD
jgi:hypothetical protein